MLDDEIIKKGIKDKSVIKAMLDVDRSKFISKKYSNIAYENQAIPIGENQTISTPFIIAFMLEYLSVMPDSNTLDVGTGSGYLAAVINKLGASVLSIEINAELAKRSAARLIELGYKEITVHHGDVCKAVSKHAFFDRIIVTATAKKIPKFLLDQLSINGRMIIPIGNELEVQYLWLITKKEDDLIIKEKLLPVYFSPLINS
jgi:protein-L-isoaspartate(D-aspartate) O-methyltransferase